MTKTNGSSYKIAAIIACFMFMISVVNVSAEIPTQYTITDLGIGSQPQDVNSSGQVAGFYFDASNQSRAFRHTAATGFQDLGLLSGTMAAAYGINELGAITGWGQRSVTWLQAAFVWTEAAGMQNYGSLSSGKGFDINDNGQIAGFGKSGNYDSPARYTPNNGWIIPRPFRSNNPALFFGINDFGDAVGWATFDGRSYAYKSNAAFDDLNFYTALPGWGETAAYAINNARNSVGWSNTDSGDIHAFLHIVEGDIGMTDLGTLGGASSEAYDINNHDEVVGFSDTTAGGQHAFIWGRNDNMLDLNDLIPANSGWELAEANGISDAGHIVGSGQLNGEAHGFLLTPVAATPTAVTVRTMTTEMLPVALLLVVGVGILLLSVTIAANKQRSMV